jgi:hypothetical protein
MDKIFGLPAHPLLVHIPIVLLPLAAVGVVVMAIRPAWHQRYRWVVLALGAAGAIGAVLAASAGEQLESRLVAREGREAAAGWERHAELGETARNVALVFLVLLACYVLIPWWLERRAAASPGTPTSVGAAAAPAVTRTSSLGRWLRPALAALAILGAAATVTTIVRAGHTGSESVWKEDMEPAGTGG